MTPAEQESYRRQFDQAKARLPKKHVIIRCEWRNGHLQVTSAVPERAAAPEQPKGRQSLLI